MDAPVDVLGRLRRSRRRAAVAVTAAAVGLAAGRALRVRRGVHVLAEHWRRRRDEPGELVYVALGDSLAQGVGASAPQRGYVGLLAADLARRSGARVRVVNLSVSGATVADVVRDQLPALTRLLAGGTRPALVTVTAGANDAGRTPPATVARALGRLLDALPAGTLVADVPDFQGGPRRPAAAGLAALVRREVAARPALVPVPLHAATGRMRWRDYSGDFFHPGDAGYRRYHAAFAAALGWADGPATPDPGARRRGQSLLLRLACRATTAPASPAPRLPRTSSPRVSS